MFFAPEPVVFDEDVVATLKLTVGTGKEHVVVAGNIKRFRVVLREYGFEADVDFWHVGQAASNEDKLFPDFKKDDPITATFSLEPENTQATTPLLMTCKGLVTERAVVERAFNEIDSKPVLQRRYFIRFVDPAAKLWGEHRPTKLYANSSLASVIADNLPKGLTVTCDWTPATVVHPITAVPLGARGDASFLDWVWWRLDELNGGLAYDSDDGTYKLVAKKAAVATSVNLEFDQVGYVEAVLPHVPRATPMVLNASTKAATAKSTIENTNAVKGVEQAFLIRSSIADDQTQRTTLETARAKAKKAELVVHFCKYPTNTFEPTDVFEFGDAWSKDLFQKVGKYRVIESVYEGRAKNQEASSDSGKDSNAYTLGYSARCEVYEDPVFRRPAYVRPQYPLEVEATVVSTIGKEDEGTYQFATDEKTSLEFYNVAVKLFDNEQIIVPYEPLYMPGHFYFPLYKDERILVGVDLHGAHILRFLDWRPTARLAAETQGDHIIWGKTQTNQTALAHAYVDEKPEWQLKRVNSKDHQVIHILEGKMFIEVAEDKDEKKSDAAQTKKQEAKKDEPKKAEEKAAKTKDAPDDSSSTDPSSGATPKAGGAESSSSGASSKANPTKVAAAEQKAASGAAAAKGKVASAQAMSASSIAKINGQKAQLQSSLAAKQAALMAGPNAALGKANALKSSAMGRVQGAQLAVAGLQASAAMVAALPGQKMALAQSKLAQAQARAAYLQNAPGALAASKMASANALVGQYTRVPNVGLGAMGVGASGLTGMTAGFGVGSMSSLSSGLSTSSLTGMSSLASASAWKSSLGASTTQMMAIGSLDAGTASAFRSAAGLGSVSTSLPKVPTSMSSLSSAASLPGAAALGSASTLATAGAALAGQAPAGAPSAADLAKLTAAEKVSLGLQAGVILPKDPPKIPTSLGDATSALGGVAGATALTGAAAQSASLLEVAKKGGDPAAIRDALQKGVDPKAIASMLPPESPLSTALVAEPGAGALATVIKGGGTDPKAIGAALAKGVEPKTLAGVLPAGSPIAGALSSEPGAAAISAALAAGGDPKAVASALQKGVDAKTLGAMLPPESPLAKSLAAEPGASAIAGVVASGGDPKAAAEALKKGVDPKALAGVMPADSPLAKALASESTGAALASVASSAGDPKAAAEALKKGVDPKALAGVLPPESPLAAALGSEATGAALAAAVATAGDPKAAADALKKGVAPRTLASVLPAENPLAKSLAAEPGASAIASAVSSAGNPGAVAEALKKGADPKVLASVLPAESPLAKGLASEASSKAIADALKKGADPEAVAKLATSGAPADAFAAVKASAGAAATRVASSGEGAGKGGLGALGDALGGAADALKKGEGGPRGGGNDHG